MSNDEESVIIKKIKKHNEGHHGGSWKIAYADFVTAMMAFFLLMWLLASTNKAQKEGIAEYFKQPLKVALVSGNSMGSQQATVVGGGNDVEKQDGVVAAGEHPVRKPQKVVKIVSPGNKETELKQLEMLRSSITVSIEEDPGLAALKDRMLMDITMEGLRIQLIDKVDRPMFDLGDDKLDKAIVQLLEKIAPLLNKLPNKIAIQGHTDAHPYEDPKDLTQTNWELSTLRANAARRALIQGGLKEEKVMSVTGFASTKLLDKKDPVNAINRRISVIVLKQERSKQLMQE